MELLWRRELPPFQVGDRGRCSQHHDRAHRVPVLTGDLPATFSPEALITLLRKDLGFGGAIVSDALEMQGRQRGDRRSGGGGTGAGGRE
jgi:beta-N-acetylhexosaminidase